MIISRRKGNNNGNARLTCHDVLKTTASVGGNVLEWLDFAVFGFFSDIIGDVFFPRGQGGDKSTIESFAVFGGAFLMRPIGGIIIGYIGDTHGRKLALEISIFLMAFATFLMGSLPTYDQVGVWAIVLLLTVRLCQGLSVGGQLMSSLVFTLESHPQEHWGLQASFVMAASNFGTLAGDVVAWFLLDALSDDDLRRWGWRLPFWAGGILVGCCGIYLKYFCPEDDDEDRFHAHGPIPTNEDGEHGDQQNGNGNHGNNNNEDDDEEHHDGLMKDKNDHVPNPTAAYRNPLKLALAKENLRSLLASSLVPMLWSGGFYISFVWLPIFMGDGKLVQPPVPNTFAINSSTLLLLMIWFPLAGALSDRLPRRLVMTYGAIGMAIFGPVAVYLIVQKHNNATAFISQLVIGISVSLWGAPMCAWLVESFDPASRLTSVSIGYNVAQAIAGGLSPLLAEVLAAEVSLTSPGIIYPILASLALFGLRCVSPGTIYGLHGAAVMGEENNNSNDSNDDDITTPKTDLNGNHRQLGDNGNGDAGADGNIYSLELKEIS
mmetsp:Transcript_28860/g.81392  ORF Transcript_28860/g.81392 Transcript_28860/m.81392 type:complete len:547 (-) Transcript_28860:666-2306(-)|eukprot:CAMPEP_0119563162 /NCGR_PEP_ID=MMETSP1352-20130426/22608_1 /TAXON_ID=265584 /ORGANISM="Stauroneis constricta, Strain CCMP1120" /LENGTH=546 /DNA_ID=CAMNT_0007611707 /DNA_START=37 /DNA_END=1677 /DNA_ORIENTATION=+